MQNESSSIVFSELQIVSKTGKFYYLIGGTNSRVMETTEDIFKNMLVAMAKLLANTKAKYGDSNELTIKAFKTYKFYEDQIDLEQGDMFSALLFPHEQWSAI